MSKKCVISVEGGLGKNIMLTALMKDLKKKYEEIYVIAPYFDVFKACPDVTDAFPMGQVSTIYQQLCLDEDCDVLWREPYANQKFIKKQCHLFDAWAEEFGITLSKPAMDMVPDISGCSELPLVKSQCNELLRQLNGQPFILVQFTGGQSPLNPQVDKDGKLLPYPNAVEGLKRNYLKAQELVNKLIAKYPKHRILHFALPNEPGYDGAEKVTAQYLTFHELAKHADKVVCTDSSLQHLVTGVCNDVTVIWGETQPEHFGYKCNKNIKSTGGMNTQPYFRPLGVSPTVIKFASPDEVMKKVVGEEDKPKSKSKSKE